MFEGHKNATIETINFQNTSFKGLQCMVCNSLKDFSSTKWIDFIIRKNILEPFFLRGGDGTKMMRMHKLFFSYSYLKMNNFCQ